jgi:hypothetical protein
MATLAETQALFWKLLAAPEGVARGLDDLDAAERRVAHRLVRDRPPLSPVERWDIYANMYFYRLRDCLREDFSAVAAIVGEASFHNLVTDYLLAHPPHHFSLRYAGEHLPEFLDTHPLLEQHPYLSALARLEYAIVDAFDAADVPPLSSDDLKRVRPEDWPHLRLQAAPSLRLLSARWPLGDLWQDAKDGCEIGMVEAKETHVRVWRKGLRVFHKTVEPSESAALSALIDGATFGAICEILVDAEAAATTLRSWIADEVLCSANPCRVPVPPFPPREGGLGG